MIFKRKKEKKKKVKVDDNLIEFIQSRGGITFKNSSYIQTGEGYIKPIHILKLPELLDDYWLNHIANIEDSISVIDIHTKDKNEVKKNIAKSIKEERSKGFVSNNFEEIYDAEKREEELKLLYDEINMLGEVVKLCDFRIYMPDRNMVSLEEKVAHQITKLDADNFESGLLLNEMKREYEALFEPYQSQRENNKFYIPGLPLTTETLAIGEPFSYSDLIDETGDYLGITDAGGCVIFDEFTKTSKRKHYSGLVVGDLGSGKSTHLKKRFKANAVKGNFIRTFDVSGEFEKITKEFGGKIIKCNSNSARINPLEIYKASSDDYTNYSRHIARVKTFFVCIKPNMTDDDTIALENGLRAFYEEKNLIPGKTEIVGLAPSSYPTFSDFLFFIDKEIEAVKKEKTNSEAEKTIIVDKTKSLIKIRELVSNIVKNYGNMFDGVSTIENITDEKIVTFDISEIKDLGNIFTAQLFNMLSLCWDNAVTNGSYMKELWDNDEVEDIDITKFLILMDEAHRLINTSMIAIAEQILKYVREARKYFTGIFFATQSIRDFIPENSTEAGVDVIKTLFERMQYKFIFQQDALACEIIKDVLGGNLTLSQIEQIPTLDTGHCILSISGDKSLMFKEAFDENLEGSIFAGGK